MLIFCEWAVTLTIVKSVVNAIVNNFVTWLDSEKLITPYLRLRFEWL